MFSDILKHRFEESLVISLILLNIFDFFKLLPTDIDFIKKIISLTILGYLIYHISLTRQIIGRRNKAADLVMLIGFFMMMMKYFVEFSKEVVSSSFMGIIYRSISINADILVYEFFYIGFLIILILSIYLGFTQHIKKPSLMAMINCHTEMRGLKHLRSTAIFFILLCFFLFVFIPMMEWLGLAVDSSLIVAAIAFYAFTAFRRHHKRFDKDYYIFRIGSFGERFYEEFIRLLHTRRGFLLISSGIICLHVISDIGNYIIPYFFGIEDFMYLKSFDQHHQSLLMILKDSLMQGGIFLLFQTVIIYMLNMIGIVSLLALPSYIWYRFYRKKKIGLKKRALVIVSISIISLLNTPVFHLSHMASETFIGVDIQSYNLNDDTTQNMISLISYAVIALLIILSLNVRRMQEHFTSLIMIISNLFLAFYTYVFFSQNMFHYGKIIILLSEHSRFAMSFIMTLFLILTISFYILGLMVFTYENYLEIKRSRV